MKLNEIFESLTYGELSMLSIGGGAQGVINESNWPRVLSHVNLALAALFTRFNLKQGRILLNLQPNVLTYNITSDHAIFNTRSRNAVKYLQDSVDQPFKDDVLKILRVLTDDEYELGLNDTSDIYSVHTVTDTQLRIPKVMALEGRDIPEYLVTDNLLIEYQASHPVISIPLGFFDPVRTEVALPRSHLQALLYNIASRAHNPMGMQNEFNMGNNWYAKYEAECQRLENEGMEIDNHAQTSRARRGGWV